MLTGIVKDLFYSFLPLFKVIFIPIFIFLSIYFLDLVYWYIYFHFYKHISREQLAIKRRVVVPNVFTRFFILAPKQIVLNFLHKKMGSFQEHGIILFEGKQGQGKTLSITHHLNDMRFKYPECTIITNYGYSYEDEEITDWHRMLTDNNGEKGIIYAIDEMPNWFSSADSKNFPVEMLEVVTQNRKNRRVIYGTCHTFSMVAKPIRIQTREVRKCHTIFGVVTIVQRLEPTFDSSGDVKKYVKRGWYWFVHDDFLYNSYDTFKVINRYQEQEQQGITSFYDYDSNAYLKFISDLKKKGK